MREEAKMKNDDPNASRYGRFYAILSNMPGADKDTMVYQFTNGRTIHLHQMLRSEYDVMCNEMERVAGYPARLQERRAALKKARSGVLHQMQVWGVDVTDWDKVNAFCEQKRIAGKGFRELSREELNKLNSKLRMMIWKRANK